MCEQLDFLLFGKSIEVWRNDATGYLVYLIDTWFDLERRIEKINMIYLPKQNIYGVFFTHVIAILLVSESTYD